MKKVYICSPLAGNVVDNLKNAIRFGEFALTDQNAAPIVPHFYTLMLNDDNPAQHELGIRAGMSLIWLVDELWVFGDERTFGMTAEIDRAKHLNIPIRYFTGEKVNKILKESGGNID